MEGPRPVRAGEHGLLNLEALRLLALLLMAVDHAAALFFPDLWWARVPGRFVFPFFALLTARALKEGVPHGKYLKRLLPFALLSQIPYGLLFPGYGGNILFTLALGVHLDRAFRERDLPGVLLGLFLSPFVDYGLLGGTLLIPLLTRLWDRPVLPVGSLVVNLFHPSAPFALLFGGLLHRGRDLPRGRRPLPWWAYYGYYPGHLALILGARALF